jgi:MFS family permease
MLSLESLFAAGSRFAGGLIGDRLDPKHVLVISQAVTLIGLVALGSGSTSELVLIIYAVGTGAGFGLTVLACSVLLINYYGRKNYLELFSIVCLAGAFAAAGPFIGGIIRDWTGSFAPAFQIYAAIAGIVTVAALVMRPPIRRTETSAKTAPSERGGNNVSNAKPA